VLSKIADTPRSGRRPNPIKPLGLCKTFKPRINTGETDFTHRACFISQLTTIKSALKTYKSKLNKIFSTSLIASRSLLPPQPRQRRRQKLPQVFCFGIFDGEAIYFQLLGGGRRLR
jgi:hypothetical protein